jgi:hypothetical protein
MVSELLDQQDLVRILSAQAIRCIDQHHLDVALCSQIAHPFETRPLERRAAKTFVFEHPLLRHLQIVAFCKLDQRRRLTRDRVFLALLLRRHSSVDRSHPHRLSPLSEHQRDAAGPVPKCHTLARVSNHTTDQTRNQSEL